MTGCRERLTVLALRRNELGEDMHDVYDESSVDCYNDNETAKKEVYECLVIGRVHQYDWGSEDCVSYQQESLDCND